MQESSRNLPKLGFPLDAVPSDVGTRVAGARRERRWTQAKLAARAGLSRASVYRVEGGSGEVWADTLFRIAHALDVSIQEFVPAWPEWEPIRGSGYCEAARERRRSLGLTMADVASTVGVSEATLSRFERGIGVSSRLLRRFGDDVVAFDDRLSVALGFDDAVAFERHVRGLAAP